MNQGGRYDNLDENYTSNHIQTIIDLVFDYTF